MGRAWNGVEEERQCPELQAHRMTHQCCPGLSVSREKENTSERGRKTRRGRVTTDQPTQWDGCEGNVGARVPEF